MLFDGKTETEDTMPEEIFTEQPRTNESAHDKRSRLTGISVLTAGHFFSDIYVGFLAPILPLLIAKFGFSMTFAGFLAAFTSFSASMTQTIFGYLSDRLSNNIFIIAGPLMAAVFFSILGYMPGKWLLVFCLMLGGVGVAQFHPLAATLVNQISQTRKGRTMAIFVTGGSIGYAVGPLVITGLIAYRDIYFVPVAIIPALFFAVIMHRYAPKIQTNGSNGRAKLTRQNFGQIASIGLYVSIGVIRSSVIMGFNAFVPILYSLRGYPLETGGFAIFMVHFFGGIGCLVGGHLSDKKSPRAIISTSFLLSVPALLLFLNSEGITAFAALGIAGFFLYSSIPAVITQAQATMPEYMSTVSSMVMGVSWGIGGMLVIIVGKSSDMFGIEPTLTVLALLPCAGFVLSLLLHHKSFEKTRLPEYI